MLWRLYDTVRSIPKHLLWESANTLSTASRKQRHRGLYGPELPAVYPRGYSVQKTTLFWRKLN